MGALGDTGYAQELLPKNALKASQELYERAKAF